jgi:cell division protein FtsI (penicillin-binding protein 3)
MDIKNEVLYRVYFLLFGILLPVAGLLLYKTVVISYVEGEHWRELGQKNYLAYRTIEAERGNILAADGSLLATSIPYFNISMDPNSSGMSSSDWEESLDSLAFCLATLVDTRYTVGGYRDYLQAQRNAGARYVSIKKKAPYAEKNMIERFPLFNKGRLKGGFIAEKLSERKRPFGLLAQRTIGYVREGAKPVGLEGYFDEVLGGTPGKQLAIKVDPKEDLWMPVDDLTLIEPETGNDIVTTLDVNLQDIVENALYRAMNYHNADWGTAILMEVETGYIRAVANLEKLEDEAGWWETYNHAVGSAVEPGSTFKLASIMALLEDGYINLEDSIDIEKGQTEFYDEVLEDSSPESFKLDSISIRRAFEMSSNVGMAKLVDKFYGRKEKINRNEGAERFIRRLKEFNLNLPTGIEINGEAEPYIKEAYNTLDQWSGTTVPWMSIGYELEITPLQLLNFYNAVANDGVMMKPMLVTEIQRFGETIERIKPIALKQRIASRGTIEKAQELLEGVVERGTAYKLKTDRYSFAGKTGTAQVGYRRGSNGTRVRGYRASFVGYFPAENPVYSCIVMINRPRQNGIYGGDVAGPVFREIADKVFATELDMHPPINRQERPVLASNELPRYDLGYKPDIEAVLEFLEMPAYGEPETDFVLLNSTNDSLTLEQRNLPLDVVPSVVGMGLRDALYVLENRGLEVSVDGFGKVVLQSIKPGTRIQGQKILLTLR